MGAIGFRWLIPILYTVALTMMMWVVYLFYGKWYVVLLTDLRTQIADFAHGRNIFDRGMSSLGTVITVVFLGFIISILAGFWTWVMAIVLAVMSAAICIASFVAMNRFRNTSPQFPGMEEEAPARNHSARPALSIKQLDWVRMLHPNAHSR